jgi:hypothetical protein
MNYVGMIGKRVVKFIGLLLVLSFVLVINAWLALEHYLNAKNALELLGTEQGEIWRDKLIGPYVGAFAAHATLPMALALTIALGQSIGFYCLFNIIFQLIQLFQHRWRHREIVRNQEQQENEQQVSESKTEVQAATTKIIENTLILLLLGGLLIVTVDYEVELFRFRSFAGIQQYDSSLDAVTIPVWGELIKEKGKFLAYQLAYSGAWGYIAFTALCCLILEVSLHKAGDLYDNIWALIEQARNQNVTPAANQEAFYGYDYDGNPVFDPNGQVYYDVDGNPTGELETDRSEGDEPTTHRVETDPNGQSQSAGINPGEAGDSEVHARYQRPIFDPPSAPAEGSSRPHGNDSTAASENDANLREVIGVPNQRVTLVEAVARPDLYYVIQATGQIWDRAYYESLHGPVDGSGDDPEPPKSHSASV